MSEPTTPKPLSLQDVVQTLKRAEAEQSPEAKQAQIGVALGQLEALSDQVIATVSLTKGAVGEEVAKAESKAPEVAMPEDMERVNAVKEVMGKNITNLEKWRTEYAQRLFEASEGQIKVVSIPDVSDDLSAEILNGAHMVDPEKQFKEMGMAVIPEIEVEGRPLQAGDLPGIFEILNDRSMTWGYYKDLNRDRQLGDTPIESGWYGFSHEVVPNTLDDNFGAMQKKAPQKKTRT